MIQVETISDIPISLTGYWCEINREIERLDIVQRFVSFAHQCCSPYVQ